MKSVYTVWRKMFHMYTVAELKQIEINTLRYEQYILEKQICQGIYSLQHVKARLNQLGVNE